MYDSPWCMSCVQTCMYLNEVLFDQGAFIASAKIPRTSTKTCAETTTSCAGTSTQLISHPTIIDKTALEHRQSALEHRQKILEQTPVSMFQRTLSMFQRSFVDVQWWWMSMFQRLKLSLFLSYSCRCSNVAVPARCFVDVRSCVCRCSIVIVSMFKRIRMSLFERIKCRCSSTLNCRCSNAVNVAVLVHIMCLFYCMNF